VSPQGAGAGLKSGIGVIKTRVRNPESDISNIEWRFLLLAVPPPPHHHHKKQKTHLLCLDFALRPPKSPTKDKDKDKRDKRQSTKKHKAQGTGTSY
jgi:hypothetical protein